MYIYTNTHTQTQRHALIALCHVCCMVMQDYFVHVTVCLPVVAPYLAVTQCAEFLVVFFSPVCDKNEHTLTQATIRVPSCRALCRADKIHLLCLSLSLFDARALNQSRAHIDVCFGIVCSSLLCRHRLLRKPHKRNQTKKNCGKLLLIIASQRRQANTTCNDCDRADTRASLKVIDESRACKHTRTQKKKRRMPRWRWRTICMHMYTEGHTQQPQQQHTKNAHASCLAMLHA